jgi:hypothetical protein
MRMVDTIAQPSKTCQAVADESGVKPEDDRGQDEHGAIVDRALLVAGRQPTPLFEPIDAALHHVAPRIDRLVEDQWTPAPSRSTLSLIAPLWNGVLDLSLAQHAPTAGITIAFVSDEAIGTRPRSSAPRSARNADAIQDRFQLRTVMAMPWADHNGKRSSATVTSEVELGGQPATAASEPFARRMVDPFFSSARLRRRRAPLAC